MENPLPSVRGVVRARSSMRSECSARDVQASPPDPLERTVEAGLEPAPKEFLANRSIELARHPDAAIPAAKAQFVSKAVLDKCDTLKEGFLKVAPTGYFGYATFDAVKKFARIPGNNSSESAKMIGITPA